MLCANTIVEEQITYLRTRTCECTVHERVCIHVHVQFPWYMHRESIVMSVSMYESVRIQMRICMCINYVRSCTICLRLL
jgi:hypothetical protein